LLRLHLQPNQKHEQNQSQLGQQVQLLQHRGGKQQRLAGGQRCPQQRRAQGNAAEDLANHRGLAHLGHQPAQQLADDHD
jgi:hypothetical protein